ncbi:MAG: DUF1993 domain-containing protein [Novosphingobium sp.]|nr:DUF1993 domain-containing protein [Novosphingobium sp.]
MSGSLHAATVPHFLRQLPQMVALLDKAEAFCAEKAISPVELLGARLADDMWPLSLQFRSCWSHSADAVESALAGKRDVDFTEPPADFEWLREQLTEAIARLEAVSPEDIDRVKDGEIKIAAGEHRLKFAVPDYLVDFALPNFYFHSSIAYAILRSRGVQIGKADYLGSLPLKG